MKVSITCPADIPNKHFQEAVQRQFFRALGNYAGSIVSIDMELSKISVEDEQQWECKVEMETLGLGCIESEAWNENPLTAVIRAVDRARQKMLSQFNSPWRQMV